jgi:pSer/pThr/pTyr-binding forkhead associated (FHA) protein
MAAILWFDEAGETKEYRIEGDEFSIGRDSSCDLCLNAGSVSRRHATIRKEGESYSVVDSSTNGTIVDGQHLQKGDNRAVDDGSTIIVGDTKLNFKMVGEEADEGRTMLMPEKKPPRLVLLEAGKVAKEFSLDVDELSIGSDDSNDVVLTGTYVSRKHARIVREGESFTIIDSSSNGTFVNSERITEHELDDGDAIKIVDHELQFVVSEAAPKMSAAAADKDKKRKLRLITLAAACVVLLILVGLLATMPSGKKGPASGEVTTPQVAASFNAVIDEADALIAQEKWTEALQKLEAVQTTSPAYLAAQRKMQAVRSEIKCIEAKPDILRLVAEENFVEAGNLLKGIPQASNCAEAVRLEYEAKLAEFCDANLKQAREKLELEGPEQAKPFVDMCLAAMPEHQEALQLAKLIEGKMGAAGTPAKQPDTEPPAPTVPPEQEKNREIARATYDRAIGAYLRGELSSAISNMGKISSLGLPPGDVTKSRAARDLEILRDAQRRYDAGTSHFRSGNTSQAYGEWNFFLAQNQKLDPNRKGVLFKEVADKMTATYCRFAEGKYKTDNYAEAFEWWSKAKEIDPDNAAAKQGLAALEKLAIKEYREGYMLAAQGSVEAAAKNFKEVLKMLPKNHEYYIKAQKKLVEIGE